MSQVYPYQNHCYSSSNLFQFCPSYIQTQSRKKSFDNSTQNQSQAENEIKQSSLNNLILFDYNFPDRKFLSNPQNSKYKIQLCRNFMNYGSCPYGQRCQYAHGKDQLRYTNVIEIKESVSNPQILSSNEKYKTKPCRQFFKKGYCLYGQTCNYLHGKTQISENNSDQPFKKSYINTQKIVDDGFKSIIKNVQNKSRLLNILKNQQQIKNNPFSTNSYYQ